MMLNWRWARKKYSRILMLPRFSETIKENPKLYLAKQRLGYLTLEDRLDWTWFYRGCKADQRWIRGGRFKRVKTVKVEENDRTE